MGHARFSVRKNQIKSNHFPNFREITAKLLSALVAVWNGWQIAVPQRTESNRTDVSSSTIWGTSTSHSMKRASLE
jgi:hypothetical protein